jgi:hypothetical protein
LGFATSSGWKTIANRASEVLERKPRRLWFCRKVLF